MPLDNNFYNRMINIFAQAMQNEFGANISKKECICEFENMGFFKLIYVYHPDNYILEIENEVRTFTITIIDREGAYNYLNRISNFKNQLDEKHIAESIKVLRSVLLKNEFDMYFHKNNKLYRKNSEGIKRVKDIKELYNG